MNEIKDIRAMLSSDWKGKIRFINLEDESQYIDVPFEVSSITGAKWGDVSIKDLIRKKELQPKELFERALQITPKQLIALYRYWGSTKSILIKNIASRLEISKREAIGIIDLAFKYNLLTQGYNSVWIVLDSNMQGVWIDRANELERGDKPLNYDMPKTPQESIDKLQKDSTPEQRAKARGEEGMIVKTVAQKEVEVEESPVEILDDSKIYSPAAQVKAKEKKQHELQAKKDSEKYMKEANKVGKPNNVEQTLPKCVTKLENYSEKAQKTLKKK